MFSIVDLYSHFPQPHQLPQPHPPQVHCPSTLQSPISIALGNVSHGTNVHDDECRKRKYPFGDNDPSLMKKKHISINDDDELVSNTASNSDNQATDGNPEVRINMLLNTFLFELLNIQHKKPFHIDQKQAQIILFFVFQICYCAVFSGLRVYHITVLVGYKMQE